MPFNPNSIRPFAFGCQRFFCVAVTVFLLCVQMLYGQQNKRVLLTNAQIITGLADKPLSQSTLLIENGKIQQIGAQGDVSGAEVIDLRGKFVAPGLIDAHVHISDFAAAKRALLSGVTTARSMGVSHFADAGLRELASAGWIDAPEILAAGYHVRPEPAAAFFMDFPEHGALLQSGVHGEQAMRTMAKAMLSRQVDWIKTNATERAGLPETDPRKPFYDQVELAALVDEAAKGGIGVAAHAHGDEGGQAAVRAGVRSIEHGTYLSNETLRLMVQKGTYLVPTIAVVEDLIHPGGDYDSPVLQMRGRHMYPRIKKTAAMARELGVKIVAATDTGYGPESTLRLALELEAFVEIGMSPFEALQAATTTAAELLGVDDHTGRIEAGLDADLIVMERNPLQEIGALHDLLMVINNGKIVVNRLVF